MQIGQEMRRKGNPSLEIQFLYLSASTHESLAFTLGLR